MNFVRFGIYTAVGTVGFYAAAGGIVYYGRQQSLFEAVFVAAADSPLFTVAIVLALLGIGLLVRNQFRHQEISE